MIEEVTKAPISISTAFRNFDPPVTLVTIGEGSLKRGHYIPEVGIVEQIWEGVDNLTLVDEATERKEPYLIQTRVTEEGFPILPKELQKNMVTQMENRLARLKELYERWKDTENVTFDNLYTEDELTNYQEHLGLKRPDPSHDPVRLAYAPPKPS